MPAPSDPTQVCLLVSYHLGYAHIDGVPSIGVYATIGAADSVTPFVQMHVERCSGTGCTTWAHVGNSDGIQYPGTAFAQAEFIDSGLAYGTIYRYRVRFENGDGVSGYSTPIEIDTTVHGDSICTSGAITDFSDEVRLSGNRSLFEFTGEQVSVSGNRDLFEWTKEETRLSGLRALFEHLKAEVRVTGLRIIVEYRDQIETDLRATKTVDNPTPLVGENVVWTVLVENISAVDATDVIVTDILPEGLLFVSYNATLGTYDDETGIWTIGTLTNGTSATINITAQVLQSGTITNTATADSTEADSNPGDNTDSESIDVDRPPCPDVPLPLSFPEDDADSEVQSSTCQDEL